MRSACGGWAWAANPTAGGGCAAGGIAAHLEQRARQRLYRPRHLQRAASSMLSSSRVGPSGTGPDPLRKGAGAEARAGAGGGIGRARLLQAARRGAVEAGDADVFLAGALLSLHQARGAVDAHDQRARHLRMQRMHLELDEGGDANGRGAESVARRAFGSSVPLCPVFSTRNMRLIHATTCVYHRHIIH